MGKAHHGENNFHDSFSVSVAVQLHRIRDGLKQISLGFFLLRAILLDFAFSKISKFHKLHTDGVTGEVFIANVFLCFVG